MTRTVRGAVTVKRDGENTTSMTSRVVIIIPAFNEETTLARTLRLLGRMHIPMTIIVVNDGSTDHTSQVARRFGARVIDFIGKGREIVEELDAHFQPKGHHNARVSLLKILKKENCLGNINN